MTGVRCLYQIWALSKLKLHKNVLSCCKRKKIGARKIHDQQNLRRTVPEPSVRDEIYRAHRLIGALFALQHFGASSSASAANNPSVLIVGEAGVGKTHLLCDVATRRIEKGWPTVVLLGEQFSAGEPWTQILQPLKLNCSREELLGALDATAQATGVRALIEIDALNEGEGEKIWRKHLAGILAHLQNYPRIGIAVTVRKSYERSIIPEQLMPSNKLIRVEHRGFQEHKYEAANRFFTHFVDPGKFGCVILIHHVCSEELQEVTSGKTRGGRRERAVTGSSTFITMRGLSLPKICHPLNPLSKSEIPKTDRNGLRFRVIPNGRNQYCYLKRSSRSQEDGFGIN